MPTREQPLILVVDDHDAGRYVMVRTLQNAGFRTIEAARGRDGLAMADAEKPDLVLLDIQLPDIDGFEVCRRLRANPALPAVAIVQVSATFEGAEYQVRALEGGADTFLADPVDPTVLVATVRAMLRLRLAEAQLREFDRRKDEFLATVAHELRNPLAPLRYCLELLEQATGNQRVVDDCLPIMKRQSDHLIRLVDDLADMSRITQNKLTLRLARVDLGQLLQTAIEARRSELDNKGLTLTADIPEQPIMLYADAVRLTQVFGNLLSNGIRYTDSGGHIAISVAIEPPDSVAIAFQDSGEGIAAADLERIFHLFVQVGRQGTGLGIGLALVHRIVRMHGGSVQATSGGLGRGSTFTVRLPLSIAQTGLPPSSLSTVEPVAALGKTMARRVLIVDDNADAVDTLATLLTSMEQDVRIAYNGRAALEIAAAFCPEVVFMDITMPDLDGFQTITRLRRIEGARNAFICTLSGHGESHARLAAAAGADRHLVKPVGKADLRQVLEAIPR
jgi:signal transduction histidine kinase